MEFATWNGFFAPAGTPKEIVAHLNAAIAAVLRMPDMQAYYASNGVEAVGSSPEEFREFIAAELARMERIVRLTGVKMEQ